MGEYPDQSSEVQAVVDMFGPADLTDTADAGLEIAARTVRRRPTFVRLERLGVVAVCAEAAALDG